MDISGQEYKKLTDALIDAFPDKASIERMVLFELDKNLDTIAGGNNLQEIVFNLIKVSKAENWIKDLIDAARKSNPGNSRLKAFTYGASIAQELLPETDTTIYIGRPPIEEKCFAAIAQPGALIRIKAPQKMGKTLLLEKLLDHSREQGHKTAKLDLKLADTDILTNLKTFLQWLCVDVSDDLELEPRLDKYWQDFYGLNKNCTRYFQKYLLSVTEHPLILAIDNFERLFAYPEIFPQFCLMLRSWYESAKSGDRIGKIWKKLRLVVVHSTEKYPELDTNHSPFNVGTTIDLPEFNLQQVEALAKKYKLDGCLGQQGSSELMMKTLGGHPYLVQKAIDYLKSQPNFSKDGETQRTQQATIEELLQRAPTEQGIFSDHLREQLWSLQHNPPLELGYKQVVFAKKPVRLDTEVGFKLHSLGLVKLLGNDCVPSCDLYRRYFSVRLE